jgi:hypothetical protein
MPGSAELTAARHMDWLALGALLAYTAWVWGGLRPSFHRAGVGWRRRSWRRWRWKARRGFPRRAARPVFYLGLAFLAFLAIQWFNAGREQYFDIVYRRWTFTDPPFARLAFCLFPPGSRADAAWFFPAWTIAVAIRSRLLARRALRGLLAFVAGSAALLAAFGLAQYASGTRAIYWRQPLDGHFFASFGYGNHAGPFFVLAESVALGLLFREILDSRRGHADTPTAMRLRHPWRVAGWCWSQRSAGRRQHGL